MKWVTRKNANVDRIACPWLIKRFVDADAEFLYVGRDEVMRVAQDESAIPYDVPNVELGHIDARCSFESILVKYELNDPALQLLGRIVHGADVQEDISIEPEAAGLRAIAHGFAYLHGEHDHEKLALESPIYDALYAWCRRRQLEEPLLDPVQARLLRMKSTQAEKIVEILDGYGIKSKALAASEEPAQWRVSVLGIDASTSDELVDHLREVTPDSMELEELCALLSSFESS